MGQTYIPGNTTEAQLAAKIFSAALFESALGESFFIGRFGKKDFIRTGDGTLISTDPSYPIYMLRDLERTNGDTIQYDLVVDIKGDAVYGDDLIRGKEKPLSIYTDQVRIDQVRQAVDAGGRMSRKRVKHDLRLLAKRRLSRWFARFYDEAITCYLAGTRGVGTAQWVLPVGWNGFAGNPLEPHDEEHSFTVDSSGGTAHDRSYASAFKLNWLDKLDTYLSTMDMPPSPVVIDGQPYYIVVLHPSAVEQLKADASPNSWLEIQKMAGVRGPDNPIFKDSLGTYGRFILYEYSKVPYVEDGGDRFAYNMVLGQQAAVIAWGDAGGKFSFTWYEELEDRGNRLVVTAGTIVGIKRARFAGKDFGSLVLWSKF